VTWPDSREFERFHVYDLLRAVQDALPIDRGRTYLADYSMGGSACSKSARAAATG
jgi:hypothetical protein